MLPTSLIDAQINQVALHSVRPHSGDGCEGSPLGQVRFQVCWAQQETVQAKSRAHGTFMIEGHIKPTNTTILGSVRCM